ncbi:polysaccharide deacetylase family protein [Sediminibacterium sp. C3]|uniref:polysaccharide deacetylase family protein n=1 Tax=Sediminibacterium sp. C3 TaxID=1267211 RepID=UPI00040B3734|nr:polysaccharide deacetylase family protein [Sediminibacterium sp. C3]
MRKWIFYILIVLISDLNNNRIPYKIYLTFDDGIGAGTLKCYKMSKKENIKATFFIIGAKSLINKNKSLLDSMKRDKTKVSIGNHSFSHANGRYAQFYDNLVKSFL